jgi:hypothetical protein
MTLGGGLLQLVAVGKQDVFLTGNPQITWFKMVYRRYTYFSIESQAIQFDGNPDFGQNITCTVPIKGDLLGPLVMEVTLPPLYVTDGTNKYLAAYVNSLGHALIQEVVLLIGEQEIDRQTGEWMEIWSELTVPAGQRQGYNNMIGRFDGSLPPPLTQPPSTATAVGTTSYRYGAVKLYIPLQFWFTKNPGLYLPLLAMQYHTVRINIKLRSLDQLVFLNTLPPTTSPCPAPKIVDKATLLDIRLYGDYVYLGVEERRRFVSNTHEYLIEQVQYTPVQGIPAANTTATIPLEFNHCIREMIWIVQRNALQANNEWFNYSTTSVNEPGIRRDILQDSLIQLDGYDRFEVRDAGYFRLVQPWQRHTNVPTGTFIYCYSFALKPEELQPSGSLNASRIDTLKLQVSFRPDPNVAITDPNYVPARGDSQVRVYATNHNVLRIVNGFAGLLFKI